MAARRDPLRRELPARDRSAPAHDRPPMEDSTLGNKKGHPRELHGARGEALRRAAAGAVHGSGSRAVPRPRSCSRTNRRPRLPRSPSVRRWCSGKTVGRSTRATAPWSPASGSVSGGAPADGGVPAVCGARVARWAGAAGGDRGGRDGNPRMMLPAGNPVPASPLHDAVCHVGAEEWALSERPTSMQFADAWGVTILGVEPPTPARGPQRAA